MAEQRVSITFTETREYRSDGPPRPPRMRMKIATRPQDWAPPARAHLFGLDSLSTEERVAEVARRRRNRNAL